MDSPRGHSIGDMTNCENDSPALANQLPTSALDEEEVLQRLHHIKKAPPHMRHLNKMRVSSPSDNLSPFSQKLMAADRVKGVQPKSLTSMLAKKATGMSGVGHSEMEDSGSGSEGMSYCPSSQEITMRRISPMKDDDGVFYGGAEMGMVDAGQEAEEEEGVAVPPSPTRNLPHRSQNVNL